MKKLLNYFKAFLSFFIPKKKIVLKNCVINIENDSDEILKDVVIFDTENYSNNNVIDKNKFNTQGNVVKQYKEGNLTISSGKENISYLELLSIFLNKSFIVEKMFVQSENGNQLIQNASLANKDQFGNLAARSLMVSFESCTSTGRNDVKIIRYAFRINNSTKLIIPCIFPKTKVTYHIPLSLDESKLNSFQKFVNWLQKR